MGNSQFAVDGNDVNEVHSHCAGESTHLFYGNTNASSITGWVNGVHVVSGDIEKVPGDSASPFSLTVLVCDGKGFSVVGESMEFRVDGVVSNKSIILRPDGLDHLELF